ncbi:MAG: glycosyltransferase, partial [Pseudomonadota bacterium]
MNAHLLPPDRPLRIALLAHSTNPRGGVVHALELGDALARLGHQVVVHAPDAKGAGFFRETLCRTRSIPASPVGADMTEMVRIRVAEYVSHFEDPAHRAFDIFHAQDGISGNALATLKERGLIR